MKLRAAAAMLIGALPAWAGGEPRQYSVDWDPAKRVVTVSARNARANPGSRPFAGLVAGDTVVIAIGVMDSHSFKPAWVGMADVR